MNDEHFLEPIATADTGSTETQALRNGATRALPPAGWRVKAFLKNGLTDSATASKMEYALNHVRNAFEAGACEVHIYRPEQPAGGSDKLSDRHE